MRAGGGPGRVRGRCAPAAVLGLGLLLAGGASPAAAGSHGIAMHGPLKYGAGFEHFDYVRPDAPRGGELRRALIGTFDNLNPFIVKGTPAYGRHLAFESLLRRAWDEPFSLYGLVAESIETPDDRSSVTFVLRPEARFHDGRPITVDDVVFSWETLKERGRPNHRLYYRQVRRVERPGARSVRFVFDGRSRDRELPMIMGLMPILSKSYFETVAFEETTLEPPLGSGPYRVERVDPGRTVVYRRDPGYWGRDLPVNRGQHNFDRVRFDYYRDADVMMEAFKAGEYDFREEASAARLATGYDFPAARDGRVKVERLAHGRPSGMRALVFNTRRAIFADRAVRYALAHAFDFDWVRRALLHGAYVRTRSIFDNSELGSRGLPEGGELALLEPFRDRLPPEIFDTAYRPPGAGRSVRANLREARRRLAGAGWSVRGGALRRDSDGLAMAFEILLALPGNEKIALAFARGLERLGAEVRVRTVDAAQYRNRRNAWDFDMLIHHWRTSLSPGNEQAFYWGTAAAGQEGARNYPGVRDPIVDEFIGRMTRVRGRAAFVDAVRAMDRVLLRGHYFVPLYHRNEDYVAWWDKFGRPEAVPLYGFTTDAWWEDPAKAAALRR